MKIKSLQREYKKFEISKSIIKEMNKIYDEYLKQEVHHRW